MYYNYSLSFFLSYLFSLFFLFFCSSIRIDCQSSSLPSSPLSPSFCSSITLIDSPPLFLQPAPDEIYVPHLRYLKQYSSSSFKNFSVSHRNTGFNEPVPKESDTSLCQWWWVDMPSKRYPVEHLLDATIAISANTPIVLYTVPDEKINSINDFIQSLINRRSKPISEGGMGGKGNITIYTIYRNFMPEYIDFRNQLEQRFDDLSWLVFESKSFTLILSLLTTAGFGGFIGPVLVTFAGALKPIAVNGDYPISLFPDAPTFIEQGYSFKVDSRIGWMLSPAAIKSNTKNDIETMIKWGANLFDQVVRDKIFRDSLESDGRIALYLSATKSKPLSSYLLNAANTLKILQQSTRPLISGQDITLQQNTVRALLICLLSLLSIWVTSILLETVRSDMKQIKKSDGISTAKMGGGIQEIDYIRRKEELLRAPLPPFFRKHKTIYRLLFFFLSFTLLFSLIVPIECQPPPPAVCLTIELVDAPSIKIGPDETFVPHVHYLKKYSSRALVNWTVLHR